MLKVLKNDEYEDNDPHNTAKKWYAEGLRFECTGCGQCCTGAPGYVWLSEQEIVDIAEYLKMDLTEFATFYLRRVNGRFSLLEKPVTFDCVFLKDKKCEIYPVRPTQCRTFPWWPQNLTNEAEWLDAAKHCEGISFNAPIVPNKIIKEQLAIQIKSLADP